MSFKCGFTSSTERTCCSSAFYLQGSSSPSWTESQAAQFGQKVIHSFQTSGTIHPMIQRNFPEELLFRLCLVNIYLIDGKKRDRTVTFEASTQYRAVVTKLHNKSWWPHERATYRVSVVVHWFCGGCCPRTFCMAEFFSSLLSIPLEPLCWRLLCVVKLFLVR